MTEPWLEVKLPCCHLWFGLPGYKIEAKSHAQRLRNWTMDDGTPRTGSSVAFGPANPSMVACTDHSCLTRYQTSMKTKMMDHGTMAHCDVKSVILAMPPSPRM